MATPSKTIVFLVALVSAILAGATTVADSPASADPAQAPCYNGVFPLNPYVDNCGITPRPPRVLGSAPDQTALLNCNVGSDVWRRMCISNFVNGGYGWLPGSPLLPGYSP